MCNAIFRYWRVKKQDFFILLHFFKITLLKLNYISQKNSINIGFNIIFCALFNGILLDKYNSILTKLF